MVKGLDQELLKWLAGGVGKLEVQGTEEQTSGGGEFWIGRELGRVEDLSGRKKNMREGKVREKG